MAAGTPLRRSIFTGEYEYLTLSMRRQYPEQIKHRCVSGVHPPEGAQTPGMGNILDDPRSESYNQ
jgi:hypothetical protein